MASARGGARKGAGRKRTTSLARVPHRTRPVHHAKHPMHVTMRRIANLPSFREQRVGTLLLRQIHRLNDARFQIVHFSIQTNHLHLVVEADDRATVTRKMSGLMIAFAKRLNLHVLGGRRGKVWADRHYRRDVETASEMHSVLRYVFGNAKKHGLIAADADALDPYSTAWTFDGWAEPVPRFLGGEHWPRPSPRTDLLRRDFIVFGLLSTKDVPGTKKRATGRNGST